MRKTAVLVLGLALGLVGCGSGPGPTPGSPPTDLPPGGTASAQPSWTSCEAAGAPVLNEPADVVIRLPRLGTDFVPTSVIVCELRPAYPNGGGQGFVAVEGRAAEPDDVAALLAAVRLPDEPRTRDECVLGQPGITWFALVDDAGRWVRPGVPFDRCGAIRVEVRRAVENLTVVDIASRPLK